ncbi:hypothetical protein EON65_32255 [archaeon]|nr:MAG: hypothetical protein EON65_32255 [archaeon]
MNTLEYKGERDRKGLVFCLLPPQMRAPTDSQTSYPLANNKEANMSTISHLSQHLKTSDCCKSARFHFWSMWQAGFELGSGAALHPPLFRFFLGDGYEEDSTGSYPTTELMPVVLELVLCARPGHEGFRDPLQSIGFFDPCQSMSSAEFIEFMNTYYL